MFLGFRGCRVFPVDTFLDEDDADASEGEDEQGDDNIGDLVVGALLFRRLDVEFTDDEALVAHGHQVDIVTQVVQRVEDEFAVGIAHLPVEVVAYGEDGAVIGVEKVLDEIRTY